MKSIQSSEAYSIASSSTNLKVETTFKSLLTTLRRRRKDSMLSKPLVEALSPPKRKILGELMKLMRDSSMLLSRVTINTSTRTLRSVDKTTQDLFTLLKDH